MLVIAALLVPPGDEAPDFALDVLPILSDHCFHCHGPDAGSRKAGLRLDTHEGALDVVIPGDVDGSELFERIVDPDPDWIMPPPDFGKPLDPAEIEVLRAWLEAGATWEEHWAFQPLEAGGPAEGGNLIDRILEPSLSASNVTPQPEAEGHIWLRRVTLDLTGLPPTLEELDRFEASIAAAAGNAERESVARRQVVDELLLRPARAEHRTREWLDVARYADTNGYQNDFRRDQWPWRDWVLRAFQANMPYDRFVLEQVAGDLVEPRDPEAVLGTGFQRNHRTVTETGSIDEEWRVENVADRAETTATAFLGLTLGCARCHDHKYDALTQRDYFRFYAFFDSIDEKGVYQETRGNVPPLLPVPSEEQETRLGELEREIASLEQRSEQSLAGAAARHASWRHVEADTMDAPTATALLEAATDELRLDGTLASTLDLGGAVAFEQDQPFTVSLWLRPAGPGAVYSRMADDDTYQGTDLVLLGDMRPAVHLIHAWTSNAIKVVGERPLIRDRWQHVAVRYDGSGRAAGVSMLVDGRPAELRVEVDQLDGSIKAAAPLRIGTRRYAGELEGSIRHFRIDGSLWTDAQILAVASSLAREEEGLPFFTACFDAESIRLRQALDSARSARDRLRDEEIPTAMVLAERAEPRVTRLLARGLYDQPTGEPLTPGIPEVFGSLPEREDGAERHDRMDLATWLVNAGNPLTARVAVNRIWASFFGRGLSSTQEDFGVRGDRPRHQGLLDALSSDFIASGWDIRSLERTIVLSRAYRRSSAAPADDLTADPTNAWLARGPRHRLDAEILRDQALAVSGLLKPRFGGPSVKPYQPDGLWAELAGGAGQGAYVPSSGDDLFRRSVYTYRKRTVPHPTLTTFDAPGFELCTVRRARTNTPLQALAILNDVTYVEAARHLAMRMLQAAAEPEARIEYGVRAVLARHPSEAEARILASALARHMEDFGADAEAAAALLSAGATAAQLDSPSAELAAYTLLASTLLNLDEALTKR